MIVCIPSVTGAVGHVWDSVGLMWAVGHFWN